MSSELDPPPVPFVPAPESPYREGHQWLAEVLDALDWNDLCSRWWTHHLHDPVLSRAESLSPQLQISVLKACLERMHWHGHRPAPEGGLSIDYYIGSLLYQIACHLYRKPLPYMERDIREILELSRHSCGHGSDVTPPFEIAQAYARKNGLTPELLASLQIFLSRLKGTKSVQANNLKRKGALLLVLCEEPVERKPACWSDSFRDGLRHRPHEEQEKWRRLVVSMNVNDVVTAPRTWCRQAKRLIDDLGPREVYERLDRWCPDPQKKSVWSIDTGGSHLLKHFIWILGMIREEEDLGSSCDALVVRISHLDWKPRQRAQKLMLAAACYLAERPPSVSQDALQRLSRWLTERSKGSTGNTMAKILKDFAARHRIESLDESTNSAMPTDSNP